MANVTIRTAWPTGTSAKAYSGHGVELWNLHGAPPGGVLETQPIGADGTATFSTLPDNDEYVIWANFGGQDHYVAVTTYPQSGLGGGGTVEIDTSGLAQDTSIAALRQSQDGAVSPVALLVAKNQNAVAKPLPLGKGGTAQVEGVNTAQLSAQNTNFNGAASGSASAWFVFTFPLQRGVRSRLGLWLKNKSTVVGLIAQVAAVDAQISPDSGAVNAIVGEYGCPPGEEHYFEVPMPGGNAFEWRFKTSGGPSDNFDAMGKVYAIS